MIRINNFQEAMQLIKEYTLISKPYGSKPIFYCLYDGKIMMINNNLKTFTTADEFEEHFNNSIFYYQEIDVDEIEIFQDYIKHRQ